MGERAELSDLIWRAAFRLPRLVMDWDAGRMTRAEYEDQAVFLAHEIVRAAAAPREEDGDG